MDFPKSVPSVGLVDGKFIDEDAVAGTPGSLIPSAWGNAVTQEILKVIQEAGLEPDEDDNTQLNAAIDEKISGASVAFASQPEAEAGELTTKAMSPLRVFQAIAKVVTQATESAFGWLKIGTQTQVNSGASDAVAVTPKKLAAASQGQAHTAFTTGGTSTALTLTPSPAIGDYAPSLRFSVKFHLDSGAEPTLNVSAKGAKAIKQYSASGAKVAAVFFAGQVGDVVYDGTDCVLLNSISAVQDASETTKGIVELATASELLTGTDNSRAATAAALLAGFLGAGGTATNDYAIFPYRDKTTGVRRQIIVQWGTGTAPGSVAAITFPTAYPNAVRSVVGMSYNNNGSGADSIELVSKSLSGFQAYCPYAPGTFDWLSVGY